MRPGRGAKVPGRAREDGEVQGAEDRGKFGMRWGIGAGKGVEKVAGDCTAEHLHSG